VITFSFPGISIWGHLGGLVFGTLATAAMVYAPRERRIPVQAGALAALVAVAVALVAVRYLTFLA
jgi:membrane associated rhomboid family serine protease